MNQDRVHAKVKEHYDFVCKKFPREQILGVFLYGSQNYNLADDEADVDTKAIYIPTLAEMAFQDPVSVELHLPNGEHCEVKDIRLMIKNWKKQNINFLEILFTDFCIVEPKYTLVWRSFQSLREQIVMYDPSKAIMSSACQALNTLNQAENSDKFRKKLANVCRVTYYLEHYGQCRPYRSIICPSAAMHDFLWDLKFNPKRSRDSAYINHLFSKERSKLEAFKEKAKELQVKQNENNYKELQKELDKKMEELALQAIQLNF